MQLDMDVIFFGKLCQISPTHEPSLCLQKNPEKLEEFKWVLRLLDMKVEKELSMMVSFFLYINL